MASYRKASAVRVRDSSWCVRARIPLDFYSPQFIHRKRTFVENIEFKEKMTGREARDKGFEIDHWTADNEVLDLKWIEAVTKTEHWKELLLRERAKKFGNVGNMRTELYTAAQDPLSYLPRGRLSEVVENEIEHWKTHDMNQKDIHPRIVAFMNLEEVEEEEVVSVRDVLYIKDYGTKVMTVTNSRDQTFEIELVEGLLNEGIVRSFILFLPSNIKLIDPTTNKLLL